MSISVITPTYNQGAYIKHTFQSIELAKVNLKSELEYIVVNANSTDQTSEIIENYKEIIDVYICEDDNGQADAIRKGLNCSTGDYVNWLNSDDFLFPKTLDLLDYFSKLDEEFDVIAFANLNCYKEGGLFNGWGGGGRRNWAWEHQAIHKGTVIFSQESTFIRRDFLVSNNIDLLDGYRTSFDHLFYMTILIKKPKILLVDIYGGVMRVHDESITITGPDIRQIQQREQKIKEIIGTKAYFLRNVFHHPVSSWIFKIHLFLIKLNVRMEFLSVYKINGIWIAEKKGNNLFANESWKINKVF
jgi:glycosyltransferase involved in cell wall biosynthesis